MLKIGITGGIGSGKTTVCKQFEALGVPVYYADDRAKWLMSNHPELVEGLKTNFGAEVYTPEGELNRTYLSKLVFGNPEKLALLNSLVHPIVYLDSESWFETQKYANFRYALKEAALLFETGAQYTLDKIIVVAAPLAIRLERVIARDKTSEEAVLARINAQMPQEEKEKLADYIIYNEKLQDLTPQIIKIHEQILHL
jgi:dephospho-CoA kinase